MVGCPSKSEIAVHLEIREFDIAVLVSSRVNCFEGNRSFSGPFSGALVNPRSSSRSIS